MPSSSVFDPTNYTALIPSGMPRWHTGSGSVTYSFLTEIPAHYDNPAAGTNDGSVIDGQLYAEGTNPTLTATQRAMAELAIARYNEVANVNLVAATGGALGQVTFGAISTGDEGLYGFAYYPTTSDPIGGDVWLNNSNGIVATPTFYDEGWDTFIHELGHALGLEHPFDGTTLPANLENSLYSVMSYDPIPTQAGVADPIQQFPATPMLYDIQAMQVLYGANMSTRAGDDVYFASGGVSGFEIANGGSLIATIWDAGGIDTFDASDQTSAVKIDLRPGYASTIGSIANNVLIALGAEGTRAMSAVIENAVGGSANDILIGNSANNVLRGNAGADQLNGLGGSDTASYEGSNAGVVVNLGNGTGRFGHAAGDTLTAIENLIGSSFGDTFLGSAIANFLQGENGNDVLRGYAGNDRIEGGEGNDQLFGDFNADTLLGGAGNDTLNGGAGGDYVDGGIGNDTIIGDADGARDIIGGGAGIDTLDYSGVTAAITVDLAAGLATGSAIGTDRLFGIERVLGGSGDDVMTGNAFTTLLGGGGGNDTLRGGTGNNSLWGGTGNDNIRGFAGFDVLNGGAGNDRLQGDANADTFVFGNGFGRDIIADFEATNDAEKIDLSAVTAITSFADLAANHLTQVGGNAVITDGFNTITLNGVNIADLDAGDFIF